MVCLNTQNNYKFPDLSSIIDLYKNPFDIYYPRGGTYLIDTIKTVQENTLKISPFTQSANSIFHFKDERKFIEEILKTKRISPRYVLEDMDYLNFPLFTELAMPMLCFCDIKLHQIINHVDFYGEFGIGFSKKWIIQKGIQPIHYLNPNSKFLNDFKNELRTLLNENHSLPEENKDYIFKKLGYIKPLFGKMWDNNTNGYVNKNFHDENEWRYIPEIINEEEFSPFIASNSKVSIDSSSYRFRLNEALKLAPNLSLCFDLKDVKYIFVRSSEDRIKIITFIQNELDDDDESKYLLISKIQTIEEIKEDY